MGDHDLHGFVLIDDRFITIDVPGFPTTATAINDWGEIVGNYGDAATNSTDGFLQFWGMDTPIDVPGANLTIPIGINIWGQVVGTTIGLHVGPQSGFLATPVQ